MAKLILGLCGEMGSGKGTFAQYLIENKKANSHRFSTMLRDVLDRLFIDQSRDNLQALSTMLRQTYGEDILAKVMYEEVLHDQNNLVVIDGVRRQSDIVFLKTLPEFKLVFVETSMETRYKRISTRGENTDDSKKTFEEFKKAHENEAESQIRDLRNVANLIIDNNGTLEVLYKQIDQLTTVNQ
jgi:dephospho-CoA kinase